MSPVRVAGLVAAAGLVGASVAAYVAWTRPTVETRRAACERRILARMGFAAREKLPREDAGGGTTRTASTLPAEVETQLRDRARQVCAHLPEEPEPTSVAQAFTASSSPACCVVDARGGCAWWSTMGCP